MAREAFGEEVVDHYLNRARIELRAPPRRPSPISTSSADSNDFEHGAAMSRRLRCMKPLIGICAAVEQARWASWDVVVAMAPQTYATAVQAAGGIAAILPPDPAVTAEPDLAARPDRRACCSPAAPTSTRPSTAPSRRPETAGQRIERDEFELALLRRAIERDMPALGICRGMQMLNVACGGTIDQHVPDRLGGSVRHREVPGTFSEHEVEIEPGSLAARGDRRASARPSSPTITRASIASATA